MEALFLPGIALVRSAAVAEPEIATARVEQAEVGRTRLRRWVELDVTDGMREIPHDVRHAKPLAPGAFERVRRRARRVPLRDDVVVGHIRGRDARRDEVRGCRITRTALGMHRVKEAVACEFWMEVEADEPAFQ